MSYEVFDEITADTLGPGDLIQIFDEDQDAKVFLILQTVDDMGDTILISGLGVDDEVQYIFSLDPDDVVNLYSEVDED